MENRFFALLLPLLLFSCAEAKYVNPVETAQGKQRIDTCQAKFASGHCVTYQWELLPTEEDFGSFVFKIYRANLADGSPVPEDLAGMAVMLWMPSMGHGSSPVTVDRLDVGTYRASQVFFSMKGNWDIHIQSKDGNAVKDEALLPISL